MFLQSCGHIQLGQCCKNCVLAAQLEKNPKSLCSALFDQKYGAKNYRSMEPKMAELHLVIFKCEENPYECPTTMVSLPGNSVGYHDVVV